MLPTHASMRTCECVREHQHTETQKHSMGASTHAHTHKDTPSYTPRLPHAHIHTPYCPIILRRQLLSVLICTALVTTPRQQSGQSKRERHLKHEALLWVQHACF